MISVTPIRYSRDVRATADFYALFGLSEKQSETSRTWARLNGNAGALGIHIGADPTDNPGRPAVVLEFTVADGELEALHTRLSDAGHAPGPITDETFGRYFTITDPDDYTVQVNETPEEFSRSYDTEGARLLL